MPEPSADSDRLLHANAWCGEEARGPVAPSLGWAMRRDLPRPGQKLSADPLNLADWQDPRVGWGVVLPDHDGLPPERRGTAADAPVIQELVDRRGHAPVFRYRADLNDGKICRYSADGTPIPIHPRGERGLGPNSVPRYLLIVGSPEQIPWKLQYRLQLDAFVGRLDLDAAGLEHYVTGLLHGWGPGVAPGQPVVWAADHGHPDITWLMRRSIAEKLARRLEVDRDVELAGGFLVDQNSSHSSLVAALAARQPAFVMTSSHGATYPLDDPAALRTNLGLPIDSHGALMDPDAVSSAWSAAGGIWYAHACCSAGTDGHSVFAGLVAPGSTLAETLQSIAKAGAGSAPLPRRLLGRTNPIRAFIGHVEPTFDWTLRDPDNGQLTTAHIVEALYGQLHLAARPPVGLALGRYFEAVAGSLLDYADAMDDVDQQVPGSPERARKNKLIALDKLATVLLGDPTVALP